ncbi:WRKY transcription factor 35 family protein [Tripterygium wilfordii]|uniref:WRKY transcription factor 35 family protein n=1 Tax=Tripterygium wilfordii TaxID=458696 RepID=A0A7J7D7V8_TRIWF|nr:probable WRKY transcription factor 35 [Tripterygium wilfordii]KAF5742413.1 WRKY transcription factor 35 family protein [Tripterygium wilfordii]
MENYQGDLTDILRASGGSGRTASSSETAATAVSSVSNWEFQSSDPIMDDQTVTSTAATSFGDPFSNMQDPLLLHHLNNIPAGSIYHHHHHHGIINTSTTTNTTTSTTVEEKGFDDDEMMKSPCNIFSRIQISQTTSPPPAKLPVSRCDSPRVVVSSGMINVNTSKDCLFENTLTHVQISPPRNLGIKRRKSQAKKVVCIPAPAAPNSRPSGEVVPSDLWAWRKYGQKPIKGSPYPRGYYRCSSTKGCSARKQVERSRADPNMLVITYTSEHNHPWPTQRNALAGSTRSHSPKTNTNTTSSKTCHQAQAKEEQKESSSNDPSAPLSPIMPSTSTSVKEEIDQNIDEFSTDGGFQSYRPSLLPPDSSSDQDFFADLGELEADPLSTLLFTTQGKESKGMDPFTLFDWSSGDTNDTQFDNK